MRLSEHMRSAMTHAVLVCSLLGLTAAGFGVWRRKRAAQPYSELANNNTRVGFDAGFLCAVTRRGSDRGDWCVTISTGAICGV